LLFRMLKRGHADTRYAHRACVLWRSARTCARTLAIHSGSRWRSCTPFSIAVKRATLGEGVCPGGSAPHPFWCIRRMDLSVTDTAPSLLMERQSGDVPYIGDARPGWGLLSACACMRMEVGRRVRPPTRCAWPDGFMGTMGALSSHKSCGTTLKRCEWRLGRSSFFVRLCGVAVIRGGIRGCSHRVWMALLLKIVAISHCVCFLLLR
jgi:hypothetical protein